MYIQTKPKKYQLLNADESNTNGVYKIKCKYDFDTIKSGELGGLVQSEDNLSQNDESWVDTTSRVIDKARVQGNSLIKQNSLISGNAVISESIINNNSNIESKNTFINNCDIENITINDDIENIEIKDSTIKGITINGSNVQIKNSTITGKISIGDNVSLNGVIIDTNGLVISSNTTIDDSIIVGDTQNSTKATVHDSYITNCKISVSGFSNCDIHMESKNSKLACGESSTISQSQISGKLYNSLIGFDSNNSNIDLRFNGIASKMCVSRSSSLLISNYNNNHLYISATNSNLTGYAICNSAKIGCNNTTNLTQLNDVGKKDENGEYIKPNFNDVNSNGSTVSYFNIYDNAYIDGAKIVESNHTNIYGNAYITGNITNSSYLDICAKVTGNITNGNYIHFYDDACIKSINGASNVYICGNSTIKSFGSNGDGAIINGNSYINGSSISGGIVNNLDDLGGNSLTDMIVNNSEISGVTADGIIINNSAIINGGELEYNEYDNRTD